MAYTGKIKNNTENMIYIVVQVTENFGCGLWPTTNGPVQHK